MKKIRATLGAEVLLEGDDIKDDAIRRAVRKRHPGGRDYKRELPLVAVTFEDGSTTRPFRFEFEDVPEVIDGVIRL